jgi:glycosyltransferase involved in cell wall biosynthesis
MNWYAIRFSAHVITVSRQAKDEILRFHPEVSADKITVVYNAPGDQFRRSDDVEIESVRRRYGLPVDYLLFVGTFNPRKNLLGAMKAMLECRKHSDWRHRLVVAAKADERYPEIIRFIRENALEGAVQLLGYVDRMDLPALYSGATALLFPSLHESYGIPLVEAFACGTPVIASNTTALPEVGADAALYVSPTDTRDLAQAILRVIADADLRQRLSSAGYRRARQFSWDRAADQVLEVYRRAVKRDRADA